MKKSDDPKIKAVEWFLDFLSDDIDNMSELEFSKRALEVDWYLFMQRFLSLENFNIIQESLASPQTQPTLAHIFLTSDLIPKKTLLKNIQADLKVILEKILKYQNPLEIRDPDEDEGGEAGIYDDGLYSEVNIGTVELSLITGSSDLSLEISPKYLESALHDPQKIMTLARVNFGFTLRGLPIGSIRTCKECSRYFLHLSKKPKYYCSPQCGSRYLSRKRREADPVGYRTKQREIMRRKYKEKKAKELGKPIDKVKIQKRVKKK